MSGTSRINAGTVTTSGSQVYTGALTIGSNVSLVGNGMTFGANVNGSGSSQLNIASTGSTTFNGVIEGGVAVTGSGVTGSNTPRVQSNYTILVGRIIVQNMLRL